MQSYGPTAVVVAAVRMEGLQMLRVLMPDQQYNHVLVSCMYGLLLRKPTEP